MTRWDTLHKTLTVDPTFGAANGHQSCCPYLVVYCKVQPLSFIPQHDSPKAPPFESSNGVKMRWRETANYGTEANKNEVAVAPSRPTSMSRQRIRELLERQREEDDRRAEKEERAREAFRPRSDRLLWVFR